MPDWYKYHLWFLVAWISCSLIQVFFELLAWKVPRHGGKVGWVNHKLNIFWGYPSLIGMIICFIFLFDTSNFQFPTYIILVISSCIVIYSGLFSAFLIQKRKGQYAGGKEELVEGYINRLRFSFLISIPVAVLAVAAELHIMTNWMADFMR